MKEDLSVITRLYEFMVWAIQRVEKFPRSQRFVIGDRLEVLLLDILDLLIEAKYSRDKRDLLRQANLQLEKLRYLIRVCCDLRLLSRSQYLFAAGQIDEIGREVGRWRKAQDENLQPSLPADL